MSAGAPGDPLFRRVLGAQAFDALPPPLRHLHVQPGTTRWRGHITVGRGRSLPARLCGWATRLPPLGRADIEVEIAASGGHERWTRRVAGHAMRSRLHGAHGLLVERLGLVEFRFHLCSRDQDIVWSVAGVRVMRVLPLPAAWFSQVRARESVEGGRYRFEVAAVLPLAGPLVHYQGWLEAAAA